MDNARPVFPAGITVPMRLTSMREVFHPSTGDNHSHWFYEFEPDMDQAALMDRDPTPTEDHYNGDDLESLMDRDRRVVVSPMRIGTRQLTMALCVGDLFDVVLVPREPLPIPDLSESALGKLMMRIFGKQEEQDDSNIVTLVPLKDLEAAEYDLPPDIEGLPDLTHVDGAAWMNMTIVERLSVIAQARADEK